jgi:hypothetical protein
MRRVSLAEARKMADRLGKIVAILVFCTLSEANAASNKKIDLQCYFEGVVGRV